MTIYRVKAKVWDYWFTCDRDGFVEIEKFFSTKEKAEKWIAENPKIIYRGFEKQKEAEKDYQMPVFKEIEKIEIE